MSSIKIVGARGDVLFLKLFADVKVFFLLIPRKKVIAELYGRDIIYVNK